MVTVKIPERTSEPDRVVCSPDPRALAAEPDRGYFLGELSCVFRSGRGSPVYLEGPESVLASVRPGPRVRMRVRKSGPVRAAFPAA